MWFRSFQQNADKIGLVPMFNFILYCNKMKCSQKVPAVEMKLIDATVINVVWELKVIVLY